MPGRNPSEPKSEFAGIPIRLRFASNGCHRGLLGPQVSEESGSLGTGTPVLSVFGGRRG